MLLIVIGLLQLIQELLRTLMGKAPILVSFLFFFIGVVTALMFVKQTVQERKTKKRMREAKKMPHITLRKHQETKNKLHSNVTIFTNCPNCNMKFKDKDISYMIENGECRYCGKNLNIY